MGDDYRQPLEAAHARIAQLERENAELRARARARPASSDEIDALRVEQELMRVEMTWQAKARQYGGSFDEAKHRAGMRVLYGLSIAFSVVGGLLGALVGKGAAPLMMLIFGSVGGLMAIVAKLVSWSFMRDRAAYEAERARVKSRLARPRIADEMAARVRVAEGLPADDDAREDLQPRNVASNTRS